MVTAAMKAILSSSVGGAPPAEITGLVDRGGIVHNVDSAVHDFNGFQIGAASEDRYVYVEYSSLCRNIGVDTTVQSITVNGVATTFNQYPGASFGGACAHAWVKVPSGTTANIKVTSNLNTTNGYARVYTFNAAGTLTLLDHHQYLWPANTVPFVVNDIQCQNKGLLFAFAIPNAAGNNVTVTGSWNGVDTAVKDYQVKYSPDGANGSGFHVSPTEDSTVRDFSFSVMDGATFITFVNSFGVS
ncbi:MAG: hypothetical protein DRP85_03310 [Candidatus Makaraimicrobium thalassicum]|nr:MAG: hypothetical protein DRP85_03310 [Candidatus Omnitrophota bacterium]